MADNKEGFSELQHHENGSTFDLQEYYNAVIDRLWLVILCIVLGGAFAAFHLRGRETQYQARSVLFLEQKEESVFGSKVQGVREDRIQSIEMINTVVDVLRGFPFARRVADHLKLNKDPDFLRAAGITQKEISVDQAAGILQGMISANFRKNTRLIDVFAVSRNPEVAIKMANAYPVEYLAMSFEQSTEATQSAGDLLLKQANQLGLKMKNAEEAMQSFRERERATSLETMLTEAQATVDAVSGRYSQSAQLLAQVDNDLSAAQGNEQNPAVLLRLPSVNADPQVAAINASIDAQQQNLDLIGQRYLPKHPLYSDARSRLELTKTDRLEVLKKVVDRLKVQRQALAAQTAELKAAKEASEQRLLVITGKKVEYDSLARELKTNEAYYEAILNRLKEVDISKSSMEQPMRIHEKAQGAMALPVALVKTIGIGILGGLLAGIALALVLNKLDPSLRSIDQTERLTGFKVVAAVPQLKDKEPGLITVRDRQGRAAEAFRTLRTSIALVGGRRKRQIFLFTSAMPSEGKTFSSANFAATLAQQGFRTLYVDADLRKPAVSQLLFGENRKPGLTEILLGRSSIESAVIATDLENLSVITAGGRSDNPVELLANSSLQDFLEKARVEYDRVVVDSAPVIAVSDTLLLAEFVDVHCLIIRANSTSRKSVNHAIRLLTELGCPPAGLILNCVPEGLMGDYKYSGRYHGSYGSKGVYGAKS